VLPDVPRVRACVFGPACLEQSDLLERLTLAVLAFHWDFIGPMHVCCCSEDKI
jgi:hypothetical protein